MFTKVHSTASAGLMYTLLSLSLPYAACGGEETSVTGSKADPRFYGPGMFSSVYVPIGKILEYPDDYDLREITIKGTVKRVEPYRWPDDPDRSQSIAYSWQRCYVHNSLPLYTFILEDDTGSLEVGVRGSASCVSGNLSYPIQMGVTEGDRVIAQVRISFSKTDSAGQNHRTPGALFSKGKRLVE